MSSLKPNTDIMKRAHNSIVWFFKNVFFNINNVSLSLSFLVWGGGCFLSGQKVLPRPEDFENTCSAGPTKCL